MNSPRKIPPPPILARTTAWSLERIQALATPELRALHANAQRLEETEIAALCLEVLTKRPRGLPSAKPTGKRKKRVRAEDE